MKKIIPTSTPVEFDGPKLNYLHEDEAPKFDTPAPKSRIRLKYFCTVSKFAELKEVTLQAVRQRIQAGDIETVLVGIDEMPFIHWTKYKNLKFKLYKNKKHGTHNTGI